MIKKISCGGFNIDTETFIEENGVLKVKNGGGGGSNSDWNASEGQPGYILNRPFYSEEQDVGEELFNGEVAAYIEGDVCIFNIDVPFGGLDYPGDRNRGNTYSVTINGETRFFDDNTPLYDWVTEWGTFSIPRSGDFGLMIYDFGQIALALFDYTIVNPEEVFQIKIEWVKKTSVMKTLAPEFLPSYLAPKNYKLYINETNSNWFINFWTSDFSEYYEVGDDAHMLFQTFKEWEENGLVTFYVSTDFGYTRVFEASVHPTSNYYRLRFISIGSVNIIGAGSESRLYKYDIDANVIFDGDGNYKTAVITNINRQSSVLSSWNT